RRPRQRWVSHEIVARGATLREAFVEAVLGLFSRLVDLANVTPRDVREVRAHGDTPEALLAHWIAECCYVHEGEGFGFLDIDLAVVDVEPRAGAEPMRLYAFLRGETVDSPGQSTDHAIKRVTAADIAIRTDAEGYEVRLAL